MTELEPLTSGRDTHVNQSYPKSAPHQATTILLRGGSSAQSRALVHFGRLADAVRGEDVLSATLSGRAVGSWPTTTLTVQPISAGWAIGFQTWNNQPSVRSASASGSTGAVADGGRFSVDVTNLVRQIAAGQQDYGWRIASSINGDRRAASFDSGDNAWRLVVVVRDPTDAPVSLAPDVGAVGVAKPWLSWESPDVGSREVPQGGFRVQIDPNMSTSAPAWDSGSRDGVDPEYDLAATTYPGATAGVTTYWRVQTRATGGDWSAWSDWAEFTYRPYPGTSILSPAAGALTDPSPVLSGQVTSGPLAAWSVAVFNDDRTVERYDSGRQVGQGSSFQAALPAKNDRGVRIFPVDGPYQLRFRFYDLNERVATPSDPGYVEVWRAVTLTAGSNPQPTNVSVQQVGRTPQIKVTWDRPATADKWAIRRNGVRVATVTSAQDPTADGEVDTTAPGVYSWVDRLAPMEQLLEYEVQAIEDDAGSQWSVKASLTPTLAGVWLIATNGDSVVLDNADVTGLGREDRRVTFSPPGVGYDVDIVTAFGGLAGEASGTVDTESPGGLKVTLERLQAMKDRPGRMVRLVYGDVNVPVFLRDLDWNPDAERWPTGRRTQMVEFSCWQGDEFRSTV